MLGRWGWRLSTCMGRRGLGELKPRASQRKWDLLSPSQLGGFGRPTELLLFMGYCHDGLQTCSMDTMRVKESHMSKKNGRPVPKRVVQGKAECSVSRWG